MLVQGLIKAGVIAVLFSPLGYLLYELSIFRLGANPVEVILHTTGTWSLRLLLLTLLLTPLQRLAGQLWTVRYRRLCGLSAFAYLCVHLLTYLWLEQQWDWAALWVDVIDRPYISVGMAAFLILLCLALTSFKAMMRYLGPRWKRLHRGVYLAVALGCLHYLWLVKADLRTPLIYTGVFALLMLLRYKPLVNGLKRRSRA